MAFRRYRHLWQFWPYFRKYIRLIIVLLFVMVTASSFGMILAWLMSEQLIGITNQAAAVMVKFTMLVMAAVIIHHTFWFLWVRLVAILSSRVAYNIRQDIMKKIIGGKFTDLKKHTSGFYNERLRENTIQIGESFHYAAGPLVDMATGLSFLVLIYFMNWQIGLFFSTGLVLLCLIELARVRVETKYIAKLNDNNAEITTKLNETYQGLKDIKGLGIKVASIQQNNECQKQNQDINIRKETVVNSWAFTRMLSQRTIDSVLVIMCALWLFPTGQITVVALLMIFNYKSLAYDTVGYLGLIKTHLMRGELGAKRVLEIVNDLQAEKWGAENHKISHANISVKDLSFSYDGKHNVLKNISFDIAPESSSVLIGASGCGKSTLFGLLSKLLETSDGKIFIGGYDINSFDEESFRHTVCIVNQDPFIFNDTILNNIKTIRPDALLEDVVVACKAANIHSEIMGFQNGYDTILAENGSNLSGGQKQRIAIARAILKDTPVILFDEPTSALDKENQALFFDVIKELKKSKTILVIAHKLNSYEIFDNVFTLRNGKFE
ncbi:MAG: ABC transporter ATP-binding protein/permease [Alphaproteobacteria bacterium]|nr:ABC transporter ATP-binding protein/permease [Alphaproteobacteria bacterium]